MVLNAVGAERAEAAEAVVIDQLRQQSREAGLAPTLPYSPGYCGMPLTEQKKIIFAFRQKEHWRFLDGFLPDAADQVGLGLDRIGEDPGP